MGKILANAVHLTDENGIVRSFLPGTTPPKWARKNITNPKAWADDVDDANQAEDDDQSDDAVDAATDQSGDQSTGDADNGEPGDVDDANQAEVKIPRKAGPGSGTDAWRAYANAKGFETDDDVSRDEIIAALNAAGIPTE